MPKQPPKYNPQSNNLVLRGTIWHVRMDVPPDARRVFKGRRVLSKSLKTGDSYEAKKRARHQLSAWWQQIDDFRGKRSSTDEWHMEVAGKVVNFTDLTDKLLADVLLRNHPNPADQLIDLGLDGVRGEWLQHDVLKHVYNHLVQAARHSEDDTVRAPQLWLDKALPPAERLKMLLDLLKDTFLDLYPDRTKAEKNEAIFIVTDPASYKPKSPITKKLQEDFKTHLLKKVKPSSAESYILKVQRFSDWLTETGNPITFLSVSEFLDETSENANTRRTYVSALSKFHKWALKYNTHYKSLFSANDKPFAEHEHDTQGEGKGNKWIPFTKEEVEGLYSVADQAGDTDLADLIMIAAYTGCRISELARLRVNVITMVNEQPFSFDVEDAKTTAGNRTIPIHPALLPVFCKRLNNPCTPNQFLFPGPDRLDGRLRIPALSERFTKLKKDQGFSDLHCFHSIRKTTTTELLRKGVDPTYIPFIIGHETGKLTFDTYTDGISMEQKVDAIQKLSFNFSNSIGLI